MTCPDTTLEPAWRDLLGRWDAQQCVYVEGRERGFDVMLSALDALLPEDIAVLDLAAGPGSISRRLLERRRNARSVAVDLDPVLQAVGRGALGDMGGRLRWVTADLRHPSWTERLEERTFDAVLSSTATHWLGSPTLATLYQSLAELVRPGGVFLNFDKFRPPRSTSSIGQVAEAVDRARQERALQSGAEAWQDWWDAARAVPALSDFFAERDRIFTPAQGRVFSTSDRHTGTSLEYHKAALAEADFSEVDVIWQDFHRKILLAVR